MNPLPMELPMDKADNRILALAISIKKDQPKRPVVFVTKDVNLRIRADALGLQTQDYEHDKVEEAEYYTGVREVELPKGIDPNSLRGQTILCARRFKEGWLQMAALLVRVRKDKSWEAWGWKDFETYCLKELHIRRQTALKLTSSYGFLERHERELLNAPADKRPAFEVVEVLARAEEAGRLSEKDYASIRDEIWKAPEEVTPTQMARNLAQKFPLPPPPQPEPAERLKRAAVSARKLSEEVHGLRQVPHALKERLDACVKELEALLPPPLQTGAGSKSGKAADKASARRVTAPKAKR